MSEYYPGQVEPVGGRSNREIPGGEPRRVTLPPFESELPEYCTVDFSLEKGRLKFSKMQLMEMAECVMIAREEADLFYQLRMRLIKARKIYTEVNGLKSNPKKLHLTAKEWDSLSTTTISNVGDKLKSKIVIEGPDKAMKMMLEGIPVVLDVHEGGTAWLE